MRACVHGQFLYDNMGKNIDPVPFGAHTHLDHRYFSHRHDGGGARATGTISTAGGTGLRAQGNPEYMEI